MDKDGWATQLGADVWDEQFRVRLEHQLWVLSRDLLAQGQSVNLEWGHWARVERDEKRLGASSPGGGSQLHYLKVPLEALIERAECRNVSGEWTASPMTALTLKNGQRFLSLPTRRRSCCSTRRFSKVDLVELVSAAEAASSRCRRAVPQPRRVGDGGQYFPNVRGAPGRDPSNCLTPIAPSSGSRELEHPVGPRSALRAGGLRSPVAKAVATSEAPGRTTEARGAHSFRISPCQRPFGTGMVP